MTNQKTMHRNLWEWCAISQALDERGMLETERGAIGFAVGVEPLPSLFAARGVRLEASGFHDVTAHSSWLETGQLGAALDGIHWPGILPFNDFCDRVTFQDINMRDLSHVKKELFDFCWSSCSYEHLGSLEAGFKFLIDPLECLRLGGISVHTTEFNVSSNSDTVAVGDSVVYRKKDIENLDRRLRKLGCAIEKMDFDAGASQYDLEFDYPSFYTHGRQHLKLKLGDYICTSMLIIIRKEA